MSVAQIAIQEQNKSLPLTERVYQNSGNRTVVDLLDGNVERVLDIGCGAGDNARLVKSRFPQAKIFGITRSEAEAKVARNFMVECWTGDIENSIPEEMRTASFDALIFSHVLEHLRDPASVIARFCQNLRKGGQIVAAVPNVLFFPMRLRFIRGDFEYDPAGGILDDTHLHFYTYFTADRYLFSKNADLRVTRKVVDAHIPLPLVRGRILPRSTCRRMEQSMGRRWPNLFGHQIVISAVKC